MYKIQKAEKLADKIYLMDVEAPRVARHCQPGQFIIVKMDEKGERIPLTICDFDREKGIVTIVFQTVGASTEKMAHLKAGDAFEDFVTINEELKKYSVKLWDRPQIIVANKADMLYDELVFEDFKKKVNELGFDKVFKMSAATKSGVEEVISFDDEKILLNTKLGALTIKGQNLKMNKLDVQNGDVMINGEIYYIVYSGKEIKKEKEGIFARLFK